MNFCQSPLKWERIHFFPSHSRYVFFLLNFIRFVDSKRMEFHCRGKEINVIHIHIQAFSHFWAWCSWTCIRIELNDMQTGELVLYRPSSTTTLSYREKECGAVVEKRKKKLTEINVDSVLISNNASRFPFKSFTVHWDKEVGISMKIETV